MIHTRIPGTPALGTAYTARLAAAVTSGQVGADVVAQTACGAMQHFGPTPALVTDSTLNTLWTSIGSVCVQPCLTTKPRYSLCLRTTPISRPHHYRHLTAQPWYFFIGGRFFPVAVLEPAVRLVVQWV